MLAKVAMIGPPNRLSDPKNSDDGTGVKRAWHHWTMSPAIMQSPWPTVLVSYKLEGSALEASTGRKFHRNDVALAI